MNNTPEKSEYEINAFKLLEASKVSILVPHLFLAEAMESGVFMTLETAQNIANYLVIGIRPDCTALMATYCKTRILGSIVRFNKEDTSTESQLMIFDCETEDLCDEKWPVVVDQIEEWSKGLREEINIMDE